MNATCLSLEGFKSSTNLGDHERVNTVYESVSSGDIHKEKNNAQTFRGKLVVMTDVQCILSKKVGIP